MTHTPKVLRQLMTKINSLYQTFSQVRRPGFIVETDIRLYGVSLLHMGVNSS
jgi:hypothetical protein